MVKSIHPFPARMAPELALSSLGVLSPTSVVLDPMSGSGTVLRQASELGHTAIGFDVDPLAVLMARVWTNHCPDDAIGRQAARLAQVVARDDVHRPANLDEPETREFVEYWFASDQAAALARLSGGISVLSEEATSEVDRAALDVLRLALSRIVVTKEQTASLARDTSHSRPHRVALTSDYDVAAGFEKSLRSVRKRLCDAPPKGNSCVRLGDARQLDLNDQSVDAVITSPPYLNAIDYLRGHRMSLVWLGWTIPELRRIRSGSIGAEKGPDSGPLGLGIASVVTAMSGADAMPNRHLQMITRYAWDLQRLMSEISRVLKDTGRATLVVGNSCLKGNFISNADGVAAAAKNFGLTEIDRVDRELPQASRYLPTTGAQLGKRMRTETVLTFAH